MAVDNITTSIAVLANWRWQGVSGGKATTRNRFCFKTDSFGQSTTIRKIPSKPDWHLPAIYIDNIFVSDAITTYSLTCVFYINQ